MGTDYAVNCLEADALPATATTPGHGHRRPSTIKKKKKGEKEGKKEKAPQHRLGGQRRISRRRPATANRYRGAPLPNRKKRKKKKGGRGGRKGPEPTTCWRPLRQLSLPVPHTPYIAILTMPEGKKRKKKGRAAQGLTTYVSTSPGPCSQLDFCLHINFPLIPEKRRKGGEFRV